MLINGIENNQIAATDRGLAYGDGLFSTIKVEHGAVQLWDYHLARFKRGAERLFFPVVDWFLLEQEVMTLAKTLSGNSLAVIKVILTRGSGGRGYSSRGCDTPLRIVSCHPFPDFYLSWQQQGINIELCQQRLASSGQLAGIKTLNRLEQILIKHELETLQALEGIVCDNDGYVVEACSANVFVYLNDQWLTPKLETSGVAGVKRQQILDAAQQSGIAIKETHLRVDELFNAQGLCITNALMGIVAVRQLQDHVYPKEGLVAVLTLQNLLNQREQLDVL
ncbi:aminodeoxychorismate lyase [Psychromonas sp. MME2]|uniref:aminodeoxychorismate lyase n=1 Tax=unclassified Psychromonas TaxID=2614957 RepID=UPI00339C0B5F